MIEATNAGSFDYAATTREPTPLEKLHDAELKAIAMLMREGWHVYELEHGEGWEAVPPSRHNASIHGSGSDGRDSVNAGPSSADR